MATPTITTDLTTLAIAEAADTGTWSGGKSSLYWTEGQIEGAGCRAFICNSITTYNLTYSPASAQNIGTSSVLRIWQNTTDPFRCEIKTNGGIALFAGDGSNTGIWYMQGSDTYYGGYEQFVIDTGTSPSTGTAPNWAAVTNMGVVNIKTVLGKNTETALLDAIRYGNILNAYAGTSGDEIDIAGIYTLDVASAYGICWKDEATNVYLIRGELNIGDTVSTNSAFFLTEGQVIIGEALEWVNTDVLQFNFVGNSTGTTNIQLLGCFVKGASIQLNMACSDTNIDALTFTGNTFGNIYGLSFQTGFTIMNNVFRDCFRVDPQGATFSNNTFSDSTDTDGAMYWDTTCTNTDTCVFNDNTLAIHIPATETGPLDFDAMLFSGNTTDVYWAGTGGTLTINLINSSNASTSSTAGGTINFVQAPVTTLITVKTSAGVEISGARVYLICDAGGPETEGTVIFNELTDVNGQVSDSRTLATDQPVYGWVRMGTNPPYYKTSYLTGPIDSNIGLSINVGMILDQ